jgi:hypothetical protein
VIVKQDDEMSAIRHWQVKVYLMACQLDSAGGL